MKKIRVYLLLCFAFNFTYAQNNVGEQLHAVKVKDWGQKTFMVTDVFWNIAKDEVINKIGKDRFENLRKYSSNDKIPIAFQLWDGNVDHKKVNFEEYKKRLGTLKVYKYITFNYKEEGKVFNQMILSVPYQKLYWDNASKWDTVYFMIGANYVEEL